MIRTAIVGCGNIGKRHVAVFDANPQTKIIALCDEDIRKGQDIDDKYGNLFMVTNMFYDIINMPEVDLVSVCTPHFLHKEMAIEALRRGKHVLVEKPMALNVKDSMEMIKVSKEVNRRLYVMKQNRFNVPITLTKEALDNGRLGKIYMVQCNVYWNRNSEYYSDSDWRGYKEKEGGALFTQASHFIDLLIWWFGDVIEAKAMVDTKMQQIEVEDCGNAVMDFSSGVQGSITWTTCVYNRNFEGSITIIGEKGTVKIGGAYLNKIDYWDVQSYPLPNNINFADLPNNYGKYQGTSSNHHKVVDEIVKDLNGIKSDIVEGEEGIKSIEAIEMIYKNAQEKSKQ
ncbi:Gfo/Idh/MocA family oxidoreductase [Reichenbachiella sp. MALMAid0571]|uniref:Gfo/Idh/MocA family protein n=1 Tax=Reichenbachiella sp. MALMAid0571 TaxID=3143939 RepID=UPI0032DF6A81